jgi:hypothetical protein
MKTPQEHVDYLIGACKSMATIDYYGQPAGIYEYQVDYGIAEIVHTFKVTIGANIIIKIPQGRAKS